MSDVEQPVVRRSDNPFRWEGVELRPYKDADSAPFSAISRQTLFSDPRLRGELRYFEIDAGGHSTLERHQHMHAVMVLRGEGACLVGDAIHALRPHDLVTIPPWTWHQFRAGKAAPLGFLCLVNAARDRPQLPDDEDLAALKADPAVAAFLGA
jgi:quercetin dioxygenase-like cupin family protein